MHLLLLEWKKWRKNVVFIIMVSFYVVLLPAILLTGKEFDNIPPPIGTNEIFFIFPTVWKWLAYVGNWLCFFFLGFLSVISITTEYSSRTLRQNIINGLTRADFFLAKLYFVLGLTLFATLYYTVCSLLIGFFNTEVIYWSKLSQNFNLIPRYFLMCSGYMIFGLFIGFLIKRTGIALFLYLAYIMFIEVILRWGVHGYLLKHKSMHFYPMNALEDLAPLPISEIANEFMRDFGFDFFLSPAEAIITTLVYTSLFLFVSFRIISRADL